MQWATRVSIRRSDHWHGRIMIASVVSSCQRQTRATLSSTLAEAANPPPNYSLVPAAPTGTSASFPESAIIVLIALETERHKCQCDAFTLSLTLGCSMPPRPTLALPVVPSGERSNVHVSSTMSSGSDSLSTLMNPTHTAQKQQHIQRTNVTNSFTRIKPGPGGITACTHMSCWLALAAATGNDLHPQETVLTGATAITGPLSSSIQVAMELTGELET